MQMRDMRLIVAGAGGRMGRTLVKAIARDAGLGARGRHGRRRLAADRQGCGRTRRNRREWHRCHGDAAPLLDKADGIVDFTVPAATVALAGTRAQGGKVHIIGTTGLSAADEAKIAEAAKTRRRLSNPAI